MDSSYQGSIFIWAPNFAPRNYAFCEGQILPISQNQALFSLLGNTYGGDGRTSYGLPDLRGRMPLGVGNGPGLAPVIYAQRGGAQTITLSARNMPTHTHGATFTPTGATGGADPVSVTMQASTNTTDNKTVPSATDNIIAGTPDGRASGEMWTNELGTNPVNMGGITSSGGGGSGGTVEVESIGNGEAFDNHSPFLALNFIIALEGLYPPRN